LLSVPRGFVAVIPAVAGVIVYYPISQVIYDQAQKAAEAESAEVDDSLGEAGLIDALIGA
jgi:hypothetical protein